MGWLVEAYGPSKLMVYWSLWLTEAYDLIKLIAYAPYGWLKLMVCWVWFQLLSVVGLCYMVMTIEFRICYIGLSTCFYVWILSNSVHTWI